MTRIIALILYLIDKVSFHLSTTHNLKTNNYMKNITTTLSLLAVTALTSQAAISYTYSYDDAPGFSSGIYEDDGAGFALTDTNTPFASGDLNDGVVYSGGNPVTDNGGATSMVAWNPAPGTPATITVDLGGLYDLSSVELTTYAFTAFNLGHPDDVTISTSVDNITYSGDQLHSWVNPANGPALESIARTDTGIRYIQLEFDGNSHTGDKWGLTELAIEGTAVPEPSSTALLGLGGLALILRRRK